MNSQQYHMVLWHPKRFPEKEASNPDDWSWDVGNLSVKSGDQIFLRRVKINPIGIVLLAEATDGPSDGEHWSGNGKKTRYAPAKVIKKTLAHPLPTKALKLLGFSHLPFRRQKPFTLSPLDGEELKKLFDWWAAASGRQRPPM